MAGGPDAIEAFRQLLSFLLSKTILDKSGAVRTILGPRADSGVISGWGSDPLSLSPLPLTNAYFLRLTVRVYREKQEDGSYKLKVSSSSYQYQRDASEGSEDWIFRYDYIRDPGHKHPESHCHVRGNLLSGEVLGEKPLQRVHFPTRRMSIESIIQLLIQDFGVPANTDASFWKELLNESVSEFHKIAHEGRAFKH